MKQADKILKDAFKTFKKKHKDIGCMELARQCNLPYSSVYNTLYTKRKCNAQIWLKIMECIGAVKVEGNSIVVSANEAFVSQESFQSSQSLCLSH